MENIVWIWLVVAVIFLIIELATPTLIFVCFVAGSVGAGLYGYFFPESYYAQIGVFVVVSIVLLPMMRKLAKKITTKDTLKSNVDALIGKIGLVTKTIDADLGGQIQIEGEVWIAGADEEIVENEKAEVISVSGTKLHIKKKE